MAMFIEEIVCFTILVVARIISLFEGLFGYIMTVVYATCMYVSIANVFGFGIEPYSVAFVFEHKPEIQVHCWILVFVIVPILARTIRMLLNHLGATEADMDEPSSLISCQLYSIIYTALTILFFVIGILVSHIFPIYVSMVIFMYRVSIDQDIVNYYLGRYISGENGAQPREPPLARPAEMQEEFNDLPQNENLPEYAAFKSIEESSRGI